MDSVSPWHRRRNGLALALSFCTVEAVVMAPVALGAAMERMALLRRDRGAGSS